VVSLDKEGLPWDHRIHASSRVFNADGTWRIKRNSDPAFVEATKAELRKLMTIPVTPAAPAAPVVPPATTGTLEAPVVTVAAVPPPPAAASGGFPELMKDITARITAGALKQEAVVAAQKAIGLDSLLALAARPDLIAQFKAALPQ
jgi:hypothetical protein